MVNYQNSKIYKIISDQTDMVYIGASWKKLCQRMAQHRSKFKEWQNGLYHYITSFDILKHSDAKIILLEHFPCETKEELNARERFYIESNDKCVNKCRPGIISDCGGKKQYRKVYREQNHDQLVEKSKKKHD